MRFPVDLNRFLPAALLCALALPAAAQTVHKCASGGGAAVYTDQDCQGRTVNTDQAPVPVKPADVRRREAQQALAQSMRPQPGESAEEFKRRRHRVGLRAEDRAECERLDKRIPVEAGSTTNPDPEEAANAKAALTKSRKQFADLKC